jgi:hypothetical protein
VFKRPLPNIAFVGVCHVDNIEGDIFGVGIFGSVEGHWECDDPNWFNSFSVEAIERLRWFFKLFLVKVHFVEGCKEENLSLTAVVD